ncbi:MAG: hypothetical protein ICV66_09090 [Chitinophagaceae bacterium]|nr:hypothetical protein [Chitinophagaceae bacterium]
MKYLVFIISFFSLCSCGGSHDGRSSVPSKERSSTIDKFATFLHVELQILLKDKTTVLANMSIRNTSEDSILLYKPLFPFDGKIDFPCFSIFNANTYEQVEFSKPVPKLSIYSDECIEDAENTVDKYFTLHSNETIQFKINLADWYDFRHEKSGEAFKVVPSISLPYVDFRYRQKFEKDTVDGKMKPVYYFLTLPEKRDIDSMRVKFTLP